MIAETKEGETLTLTLEQSGADGSVLSRVTVEWFQLENPVANQMQIDLVDAVKGCAQAWDAAKNPGGIKAM